MNYLAHIFLAAPGHDARLGALLGDFVRGRPEEAYSEVIAAEIMMHRRIDDYTDAHPVVREAKANAFAPGRRRYAGILLDVFYDHLLSTRWAAYSDQPLDEFIRDVYEGLALRRHLGPPAFQVVAERMVAQNWLGAYRELSGVKQTVDRISLRLSANGHRLRECWDDLVRHHDDLAAGFDAFFPGLIRFVAAQREGGG